MGANLTAHDQPGKQLQNQGRDPRLKNAVLPGCRGFRNQFAIDVFAAWIVGGSEIFIDG